MCRSRLELDIGLENAVRIVDVVVLLCLRDATASVLGGGKAGRWRGCGTIHVKAFHFQLHMNLKSGIKTE